MYGPANQTILYQFFHLPPSRIVHSLRTKLEDTSALFDFCCQTFCQLELPPVRHGLFAIDIFAGPDRINGLIAVLMVRRGNTDNIHIRIGKQLTIICISFCFVAIDDFLHSGPIGVTGSNDVNIFTTAL